MIETKELVEAVVKDESAAKFTPALTMADAMELAALFSALRHPMRLRLISLLAEHGDEMCVYEIAQALGLSQPTTSHHLAILLAVDLVDAYQHGLYTYHRISYKAFGRVPAAVRKLIGLEG